jgi:hypothetical protein
MLPAHRIVDSQRGIYRVKIGLTGNQVAPSTYDKHLVKSRCSLSRLVVNSCSTRDARAHTHKLSQSLRDGTLRRSSSKKFRRTVTLSVDLTCVPVGFRTTANRFPSGARS